MFALILPLMFLLQGSSSLLICKMQVKDCPDNCPQMQQRAAAPSPQIFSAMSCCREVVQPKTLSLNSIFKDNDPAFSKTPFLAALHLSAPAYAWSAPGIPHIQQDRMAYASPPLFEIKQSLLL